MDFGHEQVSNPEMRYFLQDPEYQRITRPAVLREQMIPQIDAEIVKNGHLWMETIYGGNRSQVLRTFFPEDWNAEGAKLPRGKVTENTGLGDSSSKKNGHSLF